MVSIVKVRIKVKAEHSIMKYNEKIYRTCTALRIAEFDISLILFREAEERKT